MRQYWENVAYVCSFIRIPCKRLASDEKLLVSACVWQTLDKPNFALSVEVGREARLVPEASPLKTFHNLGFCACVCVVNWQMETQTIRGNGPPVVELKVDFSSL